MKNKLFFLALLLPFSLFCQWEKKVVNTSKNLNAISFSSSTTAIVVGDTGIILKTINTGNSFTTIASGTTKNLKDVHFISGTSTGIAVGNSGTILLSTNGGSNWNKITSPSANDLNAVAFTDANNGIIVGNNGTILKTVNGGTSWTIVSPITIYLLNKVHYFSSTSVVACGANGTILKSVNGGDNWSIVNSSTKRYFTDVLIYNDSLLFVGDKGIILKADKNLNAFEKDSLCAEQLRSISCQNKTCITVGKNGRIMARENKWMAISAGYNKNYNDIQFINDTTAIAVGDSGMVLKTITGGISNSTEEIETFEAVIFPNPANGEFTISMDDIYPGKTSLQIINSLGVVVSNESFQNTNTISISENLASGIYLIRLSREHNIRIQKLIIR
ncbi:MAG: YCF48-related protein [Bacteroidetes bacterium]|nr:YCF48-related protein [Bacteroidota bacterium]